MITPAGEPPKKKATHGSPEANIQSQCFVWFTNTYPQYRGLFFAVTNQNERSGYETKKQQMISGARRRMLGVVAGVSDSIGLIPNKHFHGFCAECKTKRGYQEEAQELWQRRVERAGYHYFVYRCLEDFKTEIENYLKDALI